MKKFGSWLLALMIWLLSASSVSANRDRILGVHILNPYELDQAKLLLKTPQTQDDWQYITVPLSLNDLGKHGEWQSFFDLAKDNKLIPIVRLATRVENGAWQIPTRKDVTDLIAFLDELNWPTAEKYIIILNEPNHAKEFGSRLDPEGYARILAFASSWARSEGKNYVILPAGMDLAAPNSRITMESFAFMQRMYDYDPEVFSYVDVWNSHSYPNPGFSASPTRTDKKSLRGFQFELAFLKEITGRDWSVIITETGWVANAATLPWLESYYVYAFQHVWSDPRIIAVTPFIFQGDPGPFAGFSFLDKDGQPTSQYLAYQKLFEME